MKFMPSERHGIQAEIRAEMGRQRVSMVALSQRTGIARTTLANQINSGRLAAETLVAVARALNVPASTFLGETKAAS